MTENDVRNALKDILLYHGFLVLRVNSGGHHEENETTGKRRFFWSVIWQALGMDAQHAGVSDLLALDPTGRLWAIEAKKPGKLGEVTRYQVAFLEAVRERGGVGIVADSVDLLEKEIRERTKSR